MRTIIIIPTILLASGLCAMDKPITHININPEKDPYAFFTTIDERIQSQVKAAQTACNERNSAQMIQHLTNIVDLLEKAQINHRYVIEGYPARGPLAQDKAKRNRFEQDADQSYTYADQFRFRTKKLIELLKPTPQDPITEEEWPLMQDLFKEILPEGSLKKHAPNSDN